MTIGSMIQSSYHRLPSLCTFAEVYWQELQESVEQERKRCAEDLNRISLKFSVAGHDALEEACEEGAKMYLIPLSSLFRRIDRYIISI